LRLALALLVSTFAAAGLPALADASPSVRYGVQDDAWLAAGPGDFYERLAELRELGVQVYRFTLRWDQIETKRGVYDWTWPDAVVGGLRANGIAPVLTIWGTPRWANGGRTPNYAPRSKWALASFAKAAATRYRAQARHWLIWNEPNQRRWLRPTSARTYTGLLNVSFSAIKRANPEAKVAGGVTAPRGNVGGQNPVDWIRAMRRYRAKLDAYAHHPYPTQPRTETPWSGGCAWCKTITMADLDRLIREVRAAFPGKRIWLTEYGYQTNPPERWLGVSPARQALYGSAASLRAFRAPLVDMLIHFMVQDDGRSAGWQSGFRRLDGSAKPSYNSFKLPLAQVSRRGARTVVWGQVRPRSGRQPYRLQQWRNGGWRWAGSRRLTGTRGFWQRTVRAPRGSKLRAWSPLDGVFSPPFTVR
jgi:Glycosyl hydrolase catalytic core